MNKLKELFEAGWLISGTYDGEYYLVAGANGKFDYVKTSVADNLEDAVNQLYEECKRVSTPPSS